MSAVEWVLDVCNYGGYHPPEYGCVGPVLYLYSPGLDKLLIRCYRHCPEPGFPVVEMSRDEAAVYLLMGQ